MNLIWVITIGQLCYYNIYIKQSRRSWFGDGCLNWCLWRPAGRWWVKNKHCGAAIWLQAWTSVLLQQSLEGSRKVFQPALQTNVSPARDIIHPLTMHQRLYLPPEQLTSHRGGVHVLFSVCWDGGGWNLTAVVSEKKTTSKATEPKHEWINDKADSTDLDCMEFPSCVVNC